MAAEERNLEEKTRKRGNKEKSEGKGFDRKENRAKERKEKEAGGWQKETEKERMAVDEEACG